MNFPRTLPPLEMWGGIECTINRVGDTYFDQLERNGHAHRISDLHRFAELGIRTIRYPVQWERIAPHGLAQANWSWADERLHTLHELGISPIVGLTHHGSGPRYTSLIEPSFAEGLAQFAYAVAQRYPWVQYYTPVNEPLTTARFSGLYGHWYPHGHDDATMVQALLTECRAVVLAMQAVRRVNSAAQLVQTEDLGKIFSTPLLSYQAEWENERRWLTFDLLCGRIDRTHPMWSFLLTSGAHQAELEWFLEHPCPPNVLGIDYYLTSERFLDEHLDRYPISYHGGNRRHRYADVELVRVDTGYSLPAGYYERMKEAWERYQLPVAVTESHLGCTREEQVRWLFEAWNAAQKLRDEGVQIRAVTAWSLLGSYDWNTLVTRSANFYEPGVFDVRGPQPRPTALAGLVYALASQKQPTHAVLAQPGWWKRTDRFFYTRYAEDTTSIKTLHQTYEPLLQEHPLLIIEGKNALGNVFARFCDVRCLPYRLVTQHEMDRSSPLAMYTALEKVHPWAVIFLAASGYGEDVTLSNEQRDSKHVHEAAILANICTQCDIPLVTFSSDLVFSGTQLTPYVESDSLAPVHTRGHLQAEIERQVLGICPSALLIRTGPLFSPWEDFDVERTMQLVKKHPSSAIGQTVVSPTYVPDLVNACLDLLVDGERGCWHLANSGAISWANFARRAGHLEGPKATSGKSMLTRPHVFSQIISRALHSEHGQLLPSLDDALSRYLQEYKREQEQPVA